MKYVYCCCERSGLETSIEFNRKRAEFLVSFWWHLGFQSLSRTSLRVAPARKVIRSAVKHYLCRKAIKAVNLTSGNSNNSHLKCLRRSVSFVVNLCCETKAGRRVKKQIISNGTRWFMMLFLTLDGFCDFGHSRIDSSEWKNNKFDSSRERLHMPEHLQKNF